MDKLKAFALDPYPDSNHPLPRPIILGGMGLMIATIALCAAARATGMGMTTAPDPVTTVSRDLTFTEGDDGILRVTETAGGREVKRFESGEAGFIRAMVRGLVRNRTRYGEPGVGDFRVAMASDGDVWVEDLGTRQNIELKAFGPTQVAAFAQFIQPTRAAAR